MTRTERAIWGSSIQAQTFTSSLPTMHFTLTLHSDRNIYHCHVDVCGGMCFPLNVCRVCVCVRKREGERERVMCIVLLSLGCIHCPSHRSMYRWGCNYVPQWSFLCFFTAQELSRQRSVCAPWKLPAENHMAMRAIMDFSPPPRTPLSPSYFFSQCFSFVDEHLSRCQSMCASSNLHICTTATP